MDNDDIWQPDVDWENQSYKECIEQLYLVVRTIITILESVFDDKRTFVPVEKYLNLAYTQLLIIATCILTSQDFQTLGKIGLYRYENLIDDIEVKQRDWPEFKAELSKFIQDIEKEFARLGSDPKQISVPHVVGFVYNNAIHSLEDYRNVKSEKSRNLDIRPDITPFPENYYFDDTRHALILGDEKHILYFQSKNSSRYQIIRCLAKDLGDWVAVRQIAKCIHKSEIFVRSAINNIKPLIKKQKLDNMLRIDHSGKGEYKITLLAQHV